MLISNTLESVQIRMWDSITIMLWGVFVIIVEVIDCNFIKSTGRRWQKMLLQLLATAKVTVPALIP